MLDRSLSDVAVVSHAVLSGRSVDDELNISVRDSVADVGSALVHLENALSRDTCFLYHLEALSGCENFESKVVERLRYLDKLGLVAVAYAQQHCALLGKLCAGRFLSFVICLAEARGYTKHLAGGSHFRSKHGVYLREHVEREHCFLYAVVVDLVIAELRNGAGLASQRGSNDLRSYLNHVYAAHLGN